MVTTGVPAAISCASRHTFSDRPRVKAVDRLDAAVLFILSLLVLFCAFIISNAFFRWSLVGAGVLTFRAVIDRGRARELLTIAVLLPIAVLLTAIGNGVVRHLTPHPIDASLSGVNLYVATSVMRWFAAHLWLSFGIRTVYSALPLAMAVVLAWSNHRIALARALAFAAILAVPIYLAFPAVGPLHVSDPLAARNCIPSLHLTWALLLVPYGNRPLCIIFALLTALATLATGEHYPIDLLVAIPFAVLVHAVCASIHAHTRAWQPRLGRSTKNRPGACGTF
jgi:PAP2 superfamily